MRLARLSTLLLSLGIAFVADLGAQIVVGPRASAIQINAVGDTVVVPVVVDMSGGGGASLGSITARLTWRAPILRYIGTSPGTFGTPAVNIDSANGELRFAAASAAGDAGAPTIMQARFIATGPLGDSTLLEVVVDELTAAGTLAPLTSLPTTALVCVGSLAGRWGDATGDDAVMSNDALAILSHAVGLTAPPATAVNGDVDADGEVGSRDALVVLSFAVALDVSMFRVNQLRPTLCGSGAVPTSVVASPAAVELRPGDDMSLAVVARDAGNAIVNTGFPAWLSLTPAVADVDAFGQVTAISAGSALIVVAVAPGVADTVAVTVVGSRTVWFVNGAHTNGAEHGSAAYPFSTISQALAAAGNDDTIRIAPAEYGEVLAIAQPLVVIGDGFPRIRPTAGPAVTVSVEGTGGVIIRNLELPSTDGGVVAYGAAGLLELDSLRITGSRSTGIKARGFGSVVISGTTLLGVTDIGIDVDTNSAVTISGTTLDGVAGRDPGSLGGKALLFTSGSSLTINGSSLRGGVVRVAMVPDVRVNNSLLGDGTGPALNVAGADTIALFATRLVGTDSAGAVLATNPGGTVRLDSLALSGNGAGVLVSGASWATLDRFDFNLVGSGLFLPGVRFQNADSVSIRRGSLTGGGILLTGNSSGKALLDSVSLQGSGADISGFPLVHARAVTATGAPDNALKISTAIHALVERLEASQTHQVSFTANTGFALLLYGVDTAVVDSVWLHDNDAGALSHQFGDSLSIVRSRFATSYLNPLPTGQQGSLQVLSVRRIGISRSLIDDRISGSPYTVYHQTAGGGAMLAMDSSTILGGAYAILTYGSAADSFMVQRSQLSAGGNADFEVGAYVQSFGYVKFNENVVDSANGYGAYLYFVGRGEVRDNVIRAVRNSYGVFAYGDGSAPIDITGNSISCRRDDEGSVSGAAIFNTSGVMTGNTVQGCQAGLYMNSGSGVPLTAQISQNVIEGDTVLENSNALMLVGRYVNPVVSRNTISRGYYQDAAIAIGDPFGFQIDSARVDSNVVRRTRGNGIWARGNLQGLQLRGNRLDTLELSGPFASSDAAIRLTLNTGGARLAHDTLRGNRVQGILIENTVFDTVSIDSSVVVDDSTFAIQSYGATPVTGIRNFIARNQYGLYGSAGTWRFNLSTIQQHSQFGASADGAPWDLTNNYWGHPSGPQCDTCTAALGDRIELVNNYLPFLTAPDPGAPLGVVIAGGAPALRHNTVRARTAAGATNMRVGPVGSPSAAVRSAREQAVRRAREDLAARRRPLEGAIR